MDPSHLHPLQLLDQFLVDLDKKHQSKNRTSARSSSSDHDDANAPRGQRQQQRQHDYDNSARCEDIDIQAQAQAHKILCIAEFLYGKDSSAYARSKTATTISGSSLLDSALEILDQPSSSSSSSSSSSITTSLLNDRIPSTPGNTTMTAMTMAMPSNRILGGILHDVGSPPGGLGGMQTQIHTQMQMHTQTRTHVPPVRLIIEKKSKRKIIIVSGSSTGSSSTRSGGAEYLCTMGQESESHNNICDGEKTKAKTNAKLAMGKVGYFCSCRSYFERMKKGDRFILCKHLLAARLAPFLQGNDQGGVGDGDGDGATSIYKEYEVDESEFRTIYSRVWSSSW